MGASKSANFTQEQNELAALARALSHPARVAILQKLIRSQQCICNDIVAEIPLAQPTVSQHLKELKQAGLIQGNIEGNSICYCLNTYTWDRYMALLGPFIEHINQIKKCC
jgi:DNA-binding transcriptional ArsR family regulator